MAKGPGSARTGTSVYPNLPMYFYDADSVTREFGPHGLVEVSEIDEPSGNDTKLPFIYVVCAKV
jgi:hypothetical protein